MIRIASSLGSLGRCNACIALFSLVETTGSIPERWREVDIRFLISEVRAGSGSSAYRNKADGLTSRYFALFLSISADALIIR